MFFLIIVVIVVPSGYLFHILLQLLSGPGIIILPFFFPQLQMQSAFLRLEITFSKLLVQPLNHPVICAYCNEAKILNKLQMLCINSNVMLIKMQHTASLMNCSSHQKTGII